MSVRDTNGRTILKEKELMARGLLECLELHNGGHGERFLFYIEAGTKGT